MDPKDTKPKDAPPEKPVEPKKPDAPVEPKKDEKPVEPKPNDERNELADVFDDKPADPKPEKPEKPAGDLKLSVPDDLKDLVGKVDDYVAAAREEGFTQKQLDRFMAVHFDRVKAAAQSAGQEKERIRLETKRELMADKALGRDLKAAMTTAEKGARALGGSTLAAALARAIRGEESISPAMLVRAFHMAGLANSEDHLGERGNGVDRLAGMSAEERRITKRYGPPKDGARR